MNDDGHLTELESNWDIVWKLSTEGTITSSHAAIETMTGWPEAAWRGQPLLSIVHPDDVPTVARHLRSVEDGMLLPPFEIRIRMQNGSAVVAEAAITRLAGSDPLALVARDITERKRVEEVLRDQDARFQDLVEGTRAVPFEADCLQRRFTYVGPQAVKLLGYELEEWYAGNFWFEHVHPGDRRFVDHFPACEDWTAADQEFVYRMFTAAGQTVWVLHLVRVQTGGRKCRGFLIDVTARHEAQAELERSREQHRALTAKLQLAREQERLHVAREIHDELGQALTCLRMDAQAIHGELLPTAAGHPAVEAVLPRLQALETLATETMRSVRRIATQLRPPILDRIGLFAAIEWQASDFEARFGIRCRLERSKAEPVIDSDRATAVFRIFQEILTNVARHAQASEVRASVRVERRVLRLSVSDDGIGFGVIGPIDDAGFGILGMRERAQSFVGSLEISGSKRGTVVALSMPLGDGAAE